MYNDNLIPSLISNLNQTLDTMRNKTNSRRINTNLNSSINNLQTSSTISLGVNKRTPAHSLIARTAGLHRLIIRRLLSTRAKFSNRSRRRIRLIRSIRGQFSQLNKARNRTYLTTRIARLTNRARQHINNTRVRQSKNNARLHMFENPAIKILSRRIRISQRINSLTSTLSSKLTGNRIQRRIIIRRISVRRININSNLRITFRITRVDKGSTKYSLCTRNSRSVIRRQQSNLHLRSILIYIL